MFSSESEFANNKQSYNDNETKISFTACRICLKNFRDSYPIFTKTDDFISIKDKINYCSDLKIFENDGLPQNTCESCANDLNVSLLFKKKCLESYKKLCSENSKEIDNITIENVEYLESFREESCDSVKAKRIKVNRKNYKSKSLKSTSKLIFNDKKYDPDGKDDKLENAEGGYVVYNGFYQCKSCAKLVSTKAAMINHFKSHTGPMVCSDCNKMFPSKKLWTKHYKNVHLAYREICPKCGRAFKLAATLQAHLKTHSAVRPFECQHCNRRFLSKHNMLMHVRSHLKLKEFCCELCGMAFVSPGALRFHTIRKHAKVRPFPCTFEGCKISFAAASELSRHQLTHTSVRKHICTLCNKGFKRNDVFNKHMRKEHSCYISSLTLPSL